MMRFACRHCGRQIEKPADSAGRIVPCPDCRNPCQVPFGPARPAQADREPLAGGTDSVDLQAPSPSVDTDILPAVDSAPPPPARPGPTAKDYAALGRPAIGGRRRRRLGLPPLLLAAMIGVVVLAAALAAWMLLAG